MLCCSISRPVFLGVQVLQLVFLIVSAALFIRAGSVFLAGERDCEQDLPGICFQLYTVLSLYGVFIAAYAVAGLMANFAFKFVNRLICLHVCANLVVGIVAFVALALLSETYLRVENLMQEREQDGFGEECYLAIKVLQINSTWLPFSFVLLLLCMLVHVSTPFLVLNLSDSRLEGIDYIYMLNERNGPKDVERAKDALDGMTTIPL